jgi:hypothetical protein
MRATIHLATAQDCLALRSVLQPALERAFATGSPFGRKLAGINKEDLLTAGRQLVEERPRTRAELRTLLAARWPDYDPDSLAMAITYLLPLVQVTPRGLWGPTGPASGQPTWTPTDSWLGRPHDPDPSPDDTILRYLAAFGPATVQDIQAWCGLTRLRDATERLRPRLRLFRDENGRELLDVPDAPLPDPETPAPVRFLPEYDNVVLAHADRTRIVDEALRLRHRSGIDMRTCPFLLDGFIAGTWRIDRRRSGATLTIAPWARLAKKDAAALADEGLRLLEFAAPQDAQDVRFVAS